MPQSMTAIIIKIKYGEFGSKNIKGTQTISNTPREREWGLKRRKKTRISTYTPVCGIIIVLVL